MIELALGTALVALSALALRALRRGAAAHEPAAGSPAPRPGLAPRVARTDRARGLRVGDVLLAATDELWLAGALRFHEPADPDPPVLTLFAAPDGEGDRWVAMLDEGAHELALLRPVVLSPGSLPAELTLDGLRHDRLYELAVEVVATGERVPRRGPRARLTRYDAAESVALVVDTPHGERLALAGRRIPSHLVELLPGGDLPASRR